MNDQNSKRFALIRKRLDKHGYSQPLDSRSSLIATRLLDDLLKAQKGFETVSEQIKKLKKGSEGF